MFVALIQNCSVQRRVINRHLERISFKLHGVVSASCFERILSWGQEVPASCPTELPRLAPTPHTLNRNPTLHVRINRGVCGRSACTRHPKVPAPCTLNPQTSSEAERHLDGGGALLGRVLALSESSWARHNIHSDVDGRLIRDGGPAFKLTITRPDLSGKC